MDQCTSDLLAPARHFRDLETLLRARTRQWMAEILDEEIASALGVSSHERSPERRGYRHGTRPPRQLVTGYGPIEITVPRARIQTGEGRQEFHSQIVSRYQRRSRRVDASVLACYLAGANTRKVKLALRPLTEGTALSRSAVSRLTKRLQELFADWRSRDLSGETYPILIADAMRLPVRLARRVVKVPVQAVIGINETGEKFLLELRIAPSESLKAWEEVMEGLAARNLNAPLLVILDGNRGLLRSVRQVWPQAQIQRCTKHKLENLLAKAPKHCQRELQRDYGTITHAKNLGEAQQAYERFLRKWKQLVPEVARSLEEGGQELLSFYSFPKLMWKMLRTSSQDPGVLPHRTGGLRG